MGFFDFLRGSSSSSSNKASNHAKPDPRIGTSLDDSEDPVIDENYDLYLGAGPEDDISMRTLYKVYKSSYLLNAAVQLHAEMATGNSFYITTNEKSQKGRQAKLEIEKFCKDFDLDKFNDAVARDMWLTGNCFIVPIKFETVKNKTVVVPPRVIPLSSITEIKRDKDGNSEFYIQRVRQGTIKIPASECLHFSRKNEDGSAWGTGLGQLVCRRGDGYKTAKDTTVYRPPLYQVWEMLDDVLPKILYQGVPRFFITTDKDTPDSITKKIHQDFAKLSPGKHMVTNAEAKPQQIGLDTQSRFNDVLNKVQANSVTALTAPFLQLWNEFSFAYNSAESARDSAMPMIKGYERDHKRFIEDEIFRPIIDELFDEKTWDKIDLQLNWGEPENYEMATLVQLAELIVMLGLQDKIDVQGIIDMLRESGMDITLMKKKEEPTKKKPVSKLGEEAMKDKRRLKQQRDTAELNRRRLNVLRKLDGGGDKDEA